MDTTNSGRNHFIYWKKDWHLNKFPVSVNDQKCYWAHILFACVALKVYHGSDFLGVVAVKSLLPETADHYDKNIARKLCRFALADRYAGVQVTD